MTPPTTSPSPAPSSEADLPWLFGPAFWKILAALILLLALGIGLRTWQLQSAQADPTEVYLFTQPRVKPGQLTPVRVLLRDARVREPVPQGTVRLILQGDGFTRTLATSRTGEDGLAIFEAPIPARLAEGSYTLRVEARGTSGKASLEEPLEIRRTFKTMLSSDKPLYQPGQTIHLRALSMENDSLLPATGRAITFEVRDAKGNMVFRKTETTSDFGIAAADFKLADQVNLGSYTLAVTLGDTTSERTVQVERYTLPKYRITLATSQGFYLPGDSVRLSLQADYTFGKPVARAQVTIRAEEFIERFRPFETIQGQTGPDGRFEANLTLKNAFAGLPLNQGDAFVRFVAEVTDPTGETRSQTLQIPVSTQRIRLEAFPESGELVQNVENTLFLVSTYPDGRPAQTVIITGGGSRVETNDLGIARITLTPTENPLKLTLAARDASGTEARVVKELRVGERIDGILLRSDRPLYRQGESARLTVLSASPARRVFLDVVKDGRSFLTATIPIENGSGSLDLDLPPDLSGTVQLQAYAILDRGEIARDTKLIQIHRADQLQVEARLDAASYRPAEQALIEFLVRTRDGQPVPAALSLAIVDEAVFALNDSRPGLEEMFFIIQEEILQPRFQLVTRPSADFTSRALDDPALAEANTVLFSTATGATAGPAAARSETIPQRQQELREKQAEQRTALLGLLPGVPFAGFLLFTLGFLGYGLTRLPFKAPQSAADLHRETFRHSMRRLFYVLSGAFFAPLLLLFLPPVLTQGSALTLGVVLSALAFVIAIVALATSTAELRGLRYVKEQLPLFRRVIGVVPLLYALGFLALGATAWALHLRWDSLDPGLLQNLSYLFLGLFALVTGVVGFLRRGLSEPRSWTRNLASLGTHSLVILLPLLALSALLTGPLRAMNEVRIGEMAFADGAMPMELAMAMPGMAPSTLLAKGVTGSTGEAPRVRQFFPETLLWQPQLLTDDQGAASLRVDLADSITTWRLAGSAVSASGLLGSFQSGIPVFQDFFIDIEFPSELTQNDEVEIPVSLFNYLDHPQDIALQAEPAPWFELVDDSAAKTLSVPPGGASRSSYRLRVLQPGTHALTVMARGSALSDAVKRPVRVVPDGTRFETVINGRLEDEAAQTVTFPANAIPGGSDLFVKIYPGAFSQVVEGMDSIFRMPSGCFEQTSSTTYPNVLVLDYLRTTKQAKPELELKALEFINAGYQRLLSYEVDGGGFEWFGSPPAHNVLSAYGLLQFVDMARVYEVDPAVIDRTRDWLLAQRHPDGSWTPTEGGIAEGAIDQFQRSELATLRTTAYLAWALAESGAVADIASSFDLLAARSDAVSDPYTLALVANAFVAAQRLPEAREILRQLAASRVDEDEHSHWKGEGEALTFGRGDAFAIETTALVAQAMLRASHEVATAHRALAWLIAQRDSGGTWLSTQATVQAMRALLLGASAAGSVEGEVQVTIAANGAATNPLRITEENAGVFHLVSLSEFVRSGSNDLALTASRSSGLAYQIVAVHYEPRSQDAPAPDQPILEIETDYHTTNLAQDDLLNLTVTLRYHRPEAAPMTLVDLGIPPGFEIDPGSFQKLVQNQVIARFEPKGRQVTLYFASIPGGGTPTTFEVRFRARFPVKAQAPGAVAYQYYEPEIRASAAPVQLTVAAP